METAALVLGTGAGDVAGGRHRGRRGRSRRDGRTRDRADVRGRRGPAVVGHRAAAPAVPAAVGRLLAVALALLALLVAARACSAPAG